MQVFATLGVIFLLAFMVESLTEAVFGPLFDKIPWLTPMKWTQIYLAYAVGVAGAFIYLFDLLNIVSNFMGIEKPIPITPFGMVLTGIAIGRGASYLHDLVQKYFVKPAA